MRVQDERIFLKQDADGWDYLVAYEDEFGITMTDQGYEKCQTREEALTAARAYIQGLKRFNYTTEWVEVTDDAL